MKVFIRGVLSSLNGYIVNTKVLVLLFLGILIHKNVEERFLLKVFLKLWFSNQNTFFKFFQQLVLN